MLDGYRIVCVTPAGRRRYLEILEAYLGDQPLVDEWHLWKNTNDADDIACIHEVAERVRYAKVVEPPLFPPTDARSICQFFTLAQDPGTIYIRFDDDICWIEDGFFEDFLRFRIAHPEFFLVYPFIVNNAFCTYMLQSFGHVKLEDDEFKCSTGCMDPWGWGNGQVAEMLHKTHLEFVARGDRRFLDVPTRRFAGNRVSINCISWFGSEFAKFGGVVPHEEEEYLSAMKPVQDDLINCIYTGKAVAHFAFYSQREYLEGETDVLGRYRALAAQKAGRGVLSGRAGAPPSAGQTVGGR